jgi:formylglycine-generating enzyme required for sulfatase activity
MKIPRLLLGCVAVLVASLGAGLRAEDNRMVADLRLKLIWVNPGEFDMGTLGSGVTDERPITHVILTRGFWLGQTEVTQAQWKALMGENPSQQDGDSRPVDTVDWDDAMKFCAKLTERERAAGRLTNDLAFTLPTEAQWEYACRAGRTAYDVGLVKRVAIDYTEINAMSWNRENSEGKTHPVGRKKSNAWGFFDMQGNATEWCLSSFEHDYAGDTVTDPVFVTKDTTLRFHRGGSFDDKPPGCTSTVRSWRFNYSKNAGSGFRVALCRVR